MKLSPRLRFWKKVLEVPVEVVLCFIAGSLGVLFLPLILLWNLTVERNSIKFSVQAEILQEERNGKQTSLPDQDTPISASREYFERWADESQGLILGGVAFRDVDSGYVYHEELTHVAWEGFQTGMEYEEHRSLYGIRV